VKWTIVFNATSAASLKIKLDATGKLYNSSTGTDDAAAIDSPIAFAQNGETLVLASQAGDITVSVPGSGEYTLTVDLSDPNAWTYSVESGSVEPPVEVNQYVYLPGIDDGFTGPNWNFDRYLTLYNEDELAYAGVVNVYSLWGYTINVEEDNWNDKYTPDEGDAYSGTLIYPGKENSNIPAPDAGLYLIDVSLKGLIYNLTAIGNQIYIVGLNDNWGFDTPLTATETPGVFSGTITINGASQWGFQILLVEDDWTHYFGGWEGTLYYRGDNIKDDASLAPGAYRMTVDLIQGVYSIVQ
jgi:hypothetical protein